MLKVEGMAYLDRLRGISLSIDEGETVALVGSQGSGKTTLLRILAGQLRASAGVATVKGLSCDSPAARPLIGMAGEAWGLYPRLSVLENLTLFAKLWPVPQGRVFEVLKAVELTAQAEQRAERLRPGEAARLRLARALLHDPTVLLLDEPIGDVDRESASILSFVISEAADRGRAILLTTFGQARSLEIATRSVYLEDGTLIATEPASEPGEAPKEASAAAASASVRHVAARRNDRVFLFTPEEIRYAFAQEKQVFIQTAEGPSLITFTLTDLEDRLQSQGFFRCHRGFLVNVSWVKEIVSWTRDSFSLVLKDGKEVPLSKHRAAQLKRQLGW